MNRDDYLEAVRQVWHRNGPEPFPIGRFLSNRAIARTTADRLSAVVSDLRSLTPPAEDAADIERHYIDPLRRAAERLQALAAAMTRRTKRVEVANQMDQMIWPPEDDESHAFVLGYGLPPFWIAPLPADADGVRLWRWLRRRVGSARPTQTD